MTNLKAWAQLARVPNTFTSCADVLAGMCIAGGIHHAIEQYPLAAILGSIGSICFYWGGMVLNDVLDLEQDRLQGRPGPLVTGAITPERARQAAIGLFVVGFLLTLFAAGSVYGLAASSLPHIFPSLVVASLLIASIVAYDGPLKKTPLAPSVMGLCRSLNMGLGMALVAGALDHPLGKHAYLIALGHGIYVAGITTAARREAENLQSRTRLVWGWAISAVGVVLIAIASACFPTEPLRLDPYWVFPLLIVVLMLPLARRAWHSIESLDPRKLGIAIRQAIVSILFLDAALALQYAGDRAGLWLCVLVLPTLWLARMFRST